MQQAYVKYSYIVKQYTKHDRCWNDNANVWKKFGPSPLVTNPNNYYQCNDVPYHCEYPIQILYVSNGREIIFVESK
jgi:hypothetical protein